MVERQFSQDKSESPNVQTMIVSRHMQDDFGSLVAFRSKIISFNILIISDFFGQSEIKQLRACGRNQYVCWFDISVDKPETVNVLERVREYKDCPERLSETHGLGKFVERYPGKELIDERECLCSLIEAGVEQVHELDVLRGRFQTSQQLLIDRYLLFYVLGRQVLEHLYHHSLLCKHIEPHEYPGRRTFAQDAQHFVVVGEAPLSGFVR